HIEPVLFKQASLLGRPKGRGYAGKDTVADVQPFTFRLRTQDTRAQAQENKDAKPTRFQTRCYGHVQLCNTVVSKKTRFFPTIAFIPDFSSHLHASQPRATPANRHP